MTSSPEAPLTSSQLMLLQPDGTTPRNYDNVVAARLDRDVRTSPAAFAHALVRAVQAQAAYRLRFGEMKAWFDGRPGSSPVELVRAADRNDVVSPLDGSTFDLAHGPLVRCCIGVDHGVVRSFAISAPHIVMDGTTQSLLLSDLARALTGRVVGVCDEPRYRDYVADSLHAEERALAEHRHRWDDLVPQWGRSGVLPPAIALGPPDHHRPERAVQSLHPDLADAVVSYAKVHGAKVLDVILAGYGPWLSSLTGSDRNLVRLVTGARERKLPPFAGCLVNMVPLMLGASAADDDPVTAVSERKRQALGWRFLPYLDICRHLYLYDPDVIDALEHSTMVTVRHVGAPSGATRPLVDVDYTLAPAWPRSPVLLRILIDDGGITLDVETDHRLPGTMHADRVVAGLIDQLERMSLLAQRGSP